jgi:hypothetical protein
LKNLLGEKADEVKLKTKLQSEIKDYKAVNEKSALEIKDVKEKLVKLQSTLESEKQNSKDKMTKLLQNNIQAMKKVNEKNSQITLKLTTTEVELKESGQ